MRPLRVWVVIEMFIFWCHRYSHSVTAAALNWSILHPCPGGNVQGPDAMAGRDSESTESFRHIPSGYHSHWEPNCEHPLFQVTVLIGNPKVNSCEGRLLPLSLTWGPDPLQGSLCRKNGRKIHLSDILPLFGYLVCLSVTLQISDLWQYYVRCTRSCVTRCNLFMVLFLCRICRCRLYAVLWSNIGTLMRLLAAEHLSIAGLLFPCQYLCGTILVTPYSMLWDRRVSRAGPMPFYWPSCSLTLCLLLFSLSLLSFYGMVLWGWGLRTDRV